MNDCYYCDVSLYYPPFLIALAVLYIGCTSLAGDFSNTTATTTTTTNLSLSTKKNTNNITSQKSDIIMEGGDSTLSQQSLSNTQSIGGGSINSQHTNNHGQMLLINLKLFFEQLNLNLKSLEKVVSDIVEMYRQLENLDQELIKHKLLQRLHQIYSS